jgi:glycosyltransferase involved in cell wall biosynthesis
MKKILYYDMTTLNRWKGHPTGIARVVEKIAKELNGTDKYIIEFVAFKDNNWFYHYDLEKNELNDLVDFKKDNIFCSCGSNWDFSGYNDALKEIKNKDIIIEVLFYDIIPLVLPYSFGEGFSSIYTNWLNETLNITSNSFAISEATKKDIEKYCQEENIKYNNINVIRLGDDISIKETCIKNVKVEIRELKDYVLTVGSIEYRKNHITLLNAYRLLISEGKTNLPILVIVGREGFLNNMIVYQVENDPLLKNRVKVLSDVSDDDLDYLYRNCMFTLYPAHYEGWGLPIAESLMYGKQCICSNTSSMVEIAPNITRFAHPLKTTEWAEHIYNLYSNKDKLEEETKRVKNEYKGTHWSKTAQQLVDFIK